MDDRSGSMLYVVSNMCGTSVYIVNDGCSTSPGMS